MSEPAPKTAAQPTVSFWSTANEDSVSAYSLKVLKEIMQKATVTSVAISSTARDAQNQARVMYQNLESQGAADQKVLYGKSGDKVIDVYSDQKTKLKDSTKKANEVRDQIILEMKKKIDELGPSNVTRHAADVSKKNVFDVAPSSVTPQSQKAEFVKQAKADARVSKVLTPEDKDPGYHLEIPQT